MSLTDKIEHLMKKAIANSAGFISGVLSVSGYMLEPLVYNPTIKRHYSEKTLSPIERSSFWLDRISCLSSYFETGTTAKKLGLTTGAIGTLTGGTYILYSAAHLEEKGLIVLGTLAVTNAASGLYEGIRKKVVERKKQL